MICQKPLNNHPWIWGDDEYIMAQILTPSAPLGRIETVWIKCGFMQDEFMPDPPYIPFNLKLYKNINGMPGECLYTHFFTFPPVEQWYGFNINFQWRPEYGDSFIVAMESQTIDYVVDGQEWHTNSKVFYDTAVQLPNRNLEKSYGSWWPFSVADWGFWVVFVPNVAVEPVSLGQIKSSYHKN
jgi:hypothetical protein